MYPEMLDILQTFEFPCYTIQTSDNDQAHKTKTFQAVLVDERLALITDPGERQAHLQLNVINSGTITINIEDDDGKYSHVQLRTNYVHKNNRAP